MLYLCSEKKKLLTPKILQKNYCPVLKELILPYAPICLFYLNFDHVPT